MNINSEIDDVDNGFNLHDQSDYSQFQIIEDHNQTNSFEQTFSSKKFNTQGDHDFNELINHMNQINLNQQELAPESHKIKKQKKKFHRL